MTHTARLTVVAKRLQVLLTTKIDDVNFYDPPIKKVYYGDQERIPEVPSICIEPSTKLRSWPPKPNLMSDNQLEVDILIYHSGGDKLSEDVKYESDRLAETVEEYLLQFVTLPDADGNPLVIHSGIVTHEPGYYRRQNSLFHGSRLLWRGITKTQLTQAG
jgi:hypothetical protein